MNLTFLKRQTSTNRGKNPDEVIYGKGEVADEEYRCPICISRIDEFEYCACGGNLGVS